MTGFQRAAAVAAAFVILIGVGLLLARAIGAPVALGPSLSPGPTREPTPSATATASPEATPGASVGELAIFAQIEAEMEELRGLPPAGIGPPQVLGRADLVAELRQLFDEEYPPADRRADNITLRAMGLLQAGEDAAELQLQLLGDQVLGFYDDTDTRMVVVSDAGVDAEARFTYAHEYTHALQYANFALSSLEDERQDNDDASLALTALVEGDAVLSMFSWALSGGLTAAELLDIQQTPIPDTTGIPDWMVLTLEFPYSAGLSWLVEVAGDPLAPDFSAVDEALADPPTSTEQVLHLDKWLEREEPVPVEVADFASALGSGWEQVDSTPIGEAFMSIYLQHFGMALLEAQEAAAGWGGDRLVAAAGPDDAFAMGWVTAWDTQADADAFVAAYRDVVASNLAFPTRGVSLGNAEVLIVHASDPQVLDQTGAAVLAGR